MAAISASPSAFSSLVNNTAALQVLAKNGAALSALSNNSNFRQLMGNSAFAAALQTGNVANPINTSE